MVFGVHSLGHFWRRHKRPFLLYTLLVCLTFGTILLGLERLPNGDFSGQFHAFALFQSREMAAGRLPLWSLGSYGGFPFVADPQTAVFYPIRWLTVLGSLPWGFTYYVLEFEGILHLWLAGLFTYLLAYDILRRQDAALVSAVVFGLGGYLTSYPLLQLAILETITWLPLILLLLRRAMRDETAVHLRPLLAAALFLGVAFTAGHPQTFLQIGYLIATYAIYLGWQRRWSLGTLAKVGLLAGFATLGSATAAWLPSVAYSQASSRATVDYSFVSGGLPLEDFLQLLLPGSISFWTPVTVGTGTLLLLLLAWHGRFHLRNTGAKFWAGTAVFAAILSLGDKGFLFAILYKILPGLTLFRSQERWLAFFSFALALLAGFGVVVWQKMDETERQTAVRRWALALLLGLVGTAVSFLVAPTLASRNWWPILGQRIALLLVFALLLAKLRWPQIQLWLLALLLAGDLYLATAPGINRVPQSPSAYWPQPAWLEALHSEETVGRIDSRLIFWSNLGEIYDLADIRGISPLKYAKLARLEALPLPTRWALLNVTHIMQAEPEPGVALTAVVPITRSIVPDEPLAATLYRLDDPPPYAWMAYELISVPDDDTAFNRIATPEFDLTQQVVVTHTAIEPTQAPSVPAQVQTQTRRAGFSQLAVSTEAPGVLVLSEWDLPGWQVLVDGEPAEVLTTNYAFQGVWLPAGTHTVIWRYRPWQVPVGLAISLLVVVGTAVFLYQPRTLTAQQRRLAAWPQPALPLIALPNLGWRTSLLLLTLAAWGLRIATTAVQELRRAEGVSYQFASLSLNQILPVRFPVEEATSPLHHFMLHGLMQVAGSSELVLRLPALMAGVLLIPLMAQWGRLIGGQRVGMLAALFTAVSQPLIWLSQDAGNQFAIATSGMVLATILLVQACRQEKAFGLWLGYITTLAITVYANYLAIFALPAHAAYVWLRPQGRPKQRAWYAAGLVAALLFTPWLLTIWQQFLSPGLKTRARTDLMTHLASMSKTLTVGEAFNFPLARWVWLAALALMLGGWLWCYRQRRTWAWVLGLWLGSATWVGFLLRFRLDSFNNYSLSVVAPGGWLLIALGVVAWWQQRRRWLATGSVVTLLAASLWGVGAYYGRPDDYQRFMGYRDAATEIQALAQPGDVLLLPQPDPALDYYLRDFASPLIRQSPLAGPTDPNFVSEMSTLAAQHNRIWYLSFLDELEESVSGDKKWLDDYLLHELSAAAHHLQVQAFRPVESLDGLLTRLDRDLAGWLTLEGYYVTVNGRSAENLFLAPDDKITVTLVWQAHQPTPTDFKVFVHLLGADGQVVTQQDNMPLFNTRPTTTWQPGERLIDRYELTVPAAIAAQTVQLTTGLYEPVTGERQPFVGGETVILLENGEIRP